MATKVTSKGPVTIPKPVRGRLGIKPGNPVEFEPAADGRMLPSKAGGRSTTSRFEALRGRAGTGPTTDAVMALTRGKA